MNRKKIIRIILAALAVAALLAAGGCALWKNGFFEKINSVEALREVIAGAGVWAGAVYFALQMMTVIVAPIPSNISMMAGALALGFWPAMILGVLAVIAGAGVWAGAVYFALQMMTVIIAPIPSNISMMAGALALGFWPAMILGVLAVIAGSVIVFLAARALGRNAVQRFLDKGVMEKYLPIIEEKQDMFLFLTMLFPFFPDDALCMLAGLTKIPLGRFAAIMALARPWGLIVAALLGSGSLSLPVWAWAVIGGAGLLIFVFAMKYSAQIEEALLGLVRRIVPKRNRSDRN